MKTLAATMTALLCLLAPAFANADGHKADETPKLSIKKDGDRSLVMIGDEVFAGYNSKNTSKPYLYPIIGPTGAPMTRSYPMKKDVQGEAHDHPHHTSLWFAHGGVNGVDFWHAKKGGAKVENTVTMAPSTTAHRARIAAGDIWLNNDRKPIADVATKYGFEVLKDGSRVIDYSTSITPEEGIDQLLFADTKEGTMAIRLHPALRLKGEVATGKCVNSEGHTGGTIWGKRAKWVAYWGQIDGKTCGVAIFDHPTNLRHPTWWHARDYGLVAANPFGISDFEKLRPRGKGNFTLKQGEELNLRYRFVFFAGDAKQADIAGKYEQWVKQTTPKDE